ncbi:PSD1 and planctomycete cytochrome C domain-containing protein [Zavarzinella formosa]|uniref:PSD1 and planctomycete cytochrome C domain-containing protein n=1 Tax=Zavarzinella formosa TaxID=360055 RepID=UPI00031DF4A4|nr:PSD1 and planctomycete cytochrome C domain-containing protein [Zavarzinella formosa]
MKPCFARLVVLCVSTILPLIFAFPAIASETEGLAFFESKIRPILVEHCQQCHSKDKQKGSLRLDSRPALLKGGDSGPAVVVGKPEESILVRAVRHLKDDLKMPPDKKLKPEQIAALEQWVKMGLPDPRTTVPAGEAAAPDWETVFRERKTWWSLQPVGRHVPPNIADAEWAANPVDRFIRSKLDSAGLTPAPVADRTTLARRLSFLLTGLPPTPEDVRAFEADSMPGAEARYVDRLLGSPHYGEKWARHWMDVVRYGDTYGYEWDVPAKGAWRYRDYLIRAFNSDVPFDQLTREHLAGDLLPNPRIKADEGLNESLFGPMFFQLGEKRHGDSAMFNGIHQEMLHNKIDAFSKAFQAMTVGCAQCHDHKLDAVSQKDYYALAGMFMSPRWVSVTTDTPDRNREAIAKLRAMKPRLRAEIGQWWLESANKFAEEMRKTAEPKTPLPLEHLLRPWFLLMKAESDKKPIADVWSAMEKEYATAARDRTVANARDFRVVADCREKLPPGWSVDGVGLRDGPVRSGDFTLSLTGKQVIGRVLPGGLFSDAISPRLNGAVRTPFLKGYDQPSISLAVAGGDFAAERTIVDNAFLAERQSYLANADPAFRHYSTFPEMKDRRVFVEFATKTSNPYFPPRVGLGGACSEAQAADPKSWLGVTRAVTHSVPGSPADELGRFTGLFQGGPPKTMAEVSERYAVWLRKAVDSWAHDKATDEDVVLLNWLLQNKFLPNGEQAVPKSVTDLLDEYRKLELELKEPQTVNGMAEADPAEDYRLNIRGDYDRPTTAVPRGYLSVFPKTAPAGPGSGRRELAEFVASDRNPLTARVYVNRVWHWVFGAGLVASPDDFGHLGEKPSHPELLDWLAGWFVENGWSTKKLVRLLVTSRTFRQSGQTDAKAVQNDPRNRLLHHLSLRRLEAEEVRDAMLAASGRLDRTVFGPPVNPFRTHEDPEKRLFSGPLDGNGRRSIYTKVTLMEPPAFLAVFNQPPPKIPTGRRDVTNGPAQALAMLNDPFVLGQAEYWGAMVAKASHKTMEERLEAMFRVALGRPATTGELERWKVAVRDFASAHGIADGQVMASPVVWKDIAHAMFNVKEFIYVR